MLLPLEARDSCKARVSASIRRSKWESISRCAEVALTSEDLQLLCGLHDTSRIKYSRRALEFVRCTFEVLGV